MRTLNNFLRIAMLKHKVMSKEKNHLFLVGRLETWNLCRSTTVLHGFHVIKYLQLVLTVQTK